MGLEESLGCGRWAPRGPGGRWDFTACAGESGVEPHLAIAADWRRGPDLMSVRDTLVYVSGGIAHAAAGHNIFNREPVSS